MNGPHQFSTSVQDQLQVDKMKISCDCGLNIAAFFCKKGCLKEKKRQHYYCSECAQAHNHAPIAIAKAIKDDYGKKWSCLFEKIEQLYGNVKKIYSQIKEFNDFCEKGNDKLQENLKYKGVQKVSRDFQSLTQLYEELINKQKEMVEKFIAEFQLRDLVQLEETRQKYSEKIVKLNYLQNVSVQFLFERYYNVFVEPISIETQGYKIETSKLILDSKQKAFMEIKESQMQQEPQQDCRILTQQSTKLIQITNDMIFIQDEKCSKKISELSKKFEQSDQKILKDEIQKLKNDFAYLSLFVSNYAVIKTIILDKKDYIRTFCQLQNGNFIAGNTDNQLLKVFNSKNFQECGAVQIKGCGKHLFHIIEHQGHVIFIDNTQRIYLIRENENADLKIIADNQKIIKNCIAVANNSYIICGLQNGSLQLFEITNNTLVLKHSNQLFSNCVYQILRIGNTNQFLIRVYSKGISIINVNNNEFTPIVHTFWNKYHFNSMVVLTDNLVLAQYSTTYYVLNIEQKTETLLVEGFHTCMAMSLVPGFDIDNYPFVVTRETEWVILINIKSKAVYQIHYSSGDFDSIKTEILFLRDQGLRFLTCGKKGEILVLEINKSYLQSLL